MSNNPPNFLRISITILGIMITLGNVTFMKGKPDVVHPS